MVRNSSQGIFGVIQTFGGAGDSPIRGKGEIRVDLTGKVKLISRAECLNGLCLNSVTIYVAFCFLKKLTD